MEERHTRWWHSFWQRTQVSIRSPDGTGEQAARELAEKAGKDFDPDLVEVFASIVETRIKTEFEQKVEGEKQETPE